MAQTRQGKALDQVKKVLVIESIRPKGMEMLNGETEVVIAPDRSEATVAAMIGDFDAVVTRTTMIDREIIKRGKKLQVIGRHGAGLDTVAVDYATESGVCVVYTPEANARSVAEFAVSLMLASTRNLIAADRGQRVERDYNTRNNVMGHDLQNRTVGIIGVGRIGRLIAKMCIQGFDMKVLGFDPFVSAGDLAKLGVQKVDTVFDIFKKSDFVSLNCPLTDEVRGMVNKTTLQMMKPSAYLINCARGPIVDEAALCEALKAGVIKGASIDVYAVEPPSKDNPLFDAPNLIATPHMATMTHESMDLMSTTCAEGVLSVLRGEKPRFLADPAVWDRRKIQMK